MWLDALAAAALALPLSWAAPQVATAAGPTVTLSANLPARQPVGTTITFTGHVTGLSNPVYRFSVGSAIVRDYSLSPSFTWTPLHEGTYTIRVTAKDGFRATSSSSASGSFTITSRVSGQNSAVTPLANPLVALYSGPPCRAGSTMVL